MIISRTPHRISFLGGGTDYPDYYLNHGGKVLGVAIDKYCYLNVRKLPPFFNFKHRIVYSKQENVNLIDEIDHPAVREVFRYLKVSEGKSIHHDADIPAKSGMGSSSAFTVGLINSLMGMKGKMISKEELAHTAIFIEQKLIKENVGSQDQTFAAYGGLNMIEFLQNGKITVNPVIMDPQRLNKLDQNLLIYYSGISRFASEIAETQVKSISLNIKRLDDMKSLVDEGYDILLNNNRKLKEFGELLNETWKSKKQLAHNITNSEIDTMYEKAIRAGAIGGKLLGAGGGGFILVYAEPEKHASLKLALKGYLNIPFSFDFEGSKIIVYEPNYHKK